MNRKLLATAICAGLFATGTAYAQSTSSATQTQSDQAQQTSPTSTTSQSQSKKEKTLQTITVTGSLIPQAQIETANPVITISTQQLERSGFGSVYQALRAQPLATGSVQDNQFTGGFTPGAQTISLLGLDPGFTLYLINGHPMSDYPLLYNGQSNFVDLSDIPVGMVDHIDILPGNQSAIYGSSAIAGVINIILKDHINGYELNVRGGGYTGGGGSNERVEFLGGQTWGKLDANFGVQLYNQKPIWGYQRTLNSSTLPNPDPNDRGFGSRVFLRVNENTGQYVDPGAATCSPLSNLYGGTVGYETRPGHGNFCGTQFADGYSTILNQTKSGTGYLNLKYHLNDNTELYANVLYNVSNIRFSGGPYFWETNIDGGGIIYNKTSGNYELFQHIYSPEEIGDWKLYSTRDMERTYNAWVGVRGSIGDSDWNYDVYYARSQQKLDEEQYWPIKAAVNAFFQNQFLGPQQGFDPYYGYYPAYSPNVANFYKALTPAQYSTFNGLISSRNETYTQNINFQLTNADLFELPAGSVGFAGLAQFGGQSWQNPNDPGVIAGDFYGLTGTSGGGTRTNWAFAGELRIPITKMLTADISGRYDQYKNNGGGGTDGDVTYKATLEFRPIDTLLFRANYGTAFRAPDMSYVFGGKSGFFQPGLTDYYRCALNGYPPGPLTQCNYYANQDPFSQHSGNPNLQSVTAKSWGGGVVWSPTQNFDVKADYYNIKISNEVQLQSIDALLKTDAACRLGQLDPTSPTCIATESQVIRGPGTGPQPYQLEQVNVFPINIANEHVSGIIASLDYKHDIGRFGSLAFAAKYNVTLKHEFQQYPFDPTHDLLREPFYSTEFKTIASGSITWDVGKFETTLYGTRFGKTPNFWSQQSTAGYTAPCSKPLNGYTQCTGHVAPWMIYNASVSYDITPDMKISGIVNNIKNSMPPGDYTDNSSPYYNFTNYNSYGRQYWVEFDWKFGQH